MFVLCIYGKNKICLNYKIGDRNPSK